MDRRLRISRRRTDDRVLNSEFGMRNAERKKEDRIRNAECGMRNADLSDFHHVTRNAQPGTVTRNK